MTEEKSNQETVSEDHDTKSDGALLIAITAIFIIAILVIFLPRYFVPSEPTLEELHISNMKGELTEEEGYLHDGTYSFVNFDGLWYTQMQTTEGSRLFNIPFHYSPKDVLDIVPSGYINTTTINQYQSSFMTFNPEDPDLNFVAVSIGETNSILIQVFGKGVIAACAENKTDACADRPIVKCGSTDAPIFYYIASTETKVEYENNCIKISGEKEELLRATDRVLFDLLGIV